jgi:hypothetical protein
MSPPGRCEGLVPERFGREGTPVRADRGASRSAPPAPAARRHEPAAALLAMVTATLLAEATASPPGPAASASAARAAPPAAGVRVAVRIELDGAADAAAEATLRRTLAALGGELRARLTLGGPAFLAELPADALGRLRRAPGVRRVGVVPDATTTRAPSR